MVGSSIFQFASAKYFGLQGIQDAEDLSTWRPTEPAVTETNCTSLFGSTMNVARSAHRRR